MPSAEEVSKEERTKNRRKRGKKRREKKNPKRKGRVVKYEPICSYFPMDSPSLLLISGILVWMLVNLLWFLFIISYFLGLHLG